MRDLSFSSRSGPRSGGTPIRVRLAVQDTFFPVNEKVKRIGTRQVEESMGCAFGALRASCAH